MRAGRHNLRDLRGSNVVEKSLIKRIIRIAFGVFFLLLGIIGLLTPVLQGVLFILFGLVLLSRDVPFVRRLVKRLRGRFPRLFTGLRKVESRMAVRWQKIVRFFRRKRARSPQPANGLENRNSKKDVAK